MQSLKKKEEQTRLNFRLNKAVKERIEKAALYMGQTVSSFTISATLERADKVLKDHSVLQLSQEDSEIFFKMLTSDDPVPDSVIKRYKKSRLKVSYE